MNPYELQRYISVYKSNPFLFDDDFVDEIEKASKELDIPFKRNISAEKSKQDNLLNQFVSGFSEGFTTLGWADAPTSESGQIVHSMGHLLGFVPALAGTIFSGGAYGAARGALAVGQATKVGRALQTTSSFMSRTAKSAQGVKSVPFLVGDALNKQLYKGLAKAGVSVDKYVLAGSKTADVLMSAQHLGAASAISGIWGGKDEVMNSYVHGAIAGGVFGTIGNFMNIGKMVGHPNPNVRKGAEEWIWQKVAQGVAGGAFQGGMATAQGAPTSVQIYEYLLGGFFGYSHPNAKIKAAKKHMSEFNKGGQFADREREMTSVDEFALLPEESQIYVKNYFNKHIGGRFKTYNPQMELFPDLKEDDPTYAAVYAKARHTEVIKERSLEKRRKELMNERNEELTEEDETLAKIRAMDDVDTFTQSMREGEIAAEVTDKTRNEGLSVSNEADVVYNQMSEKEIARVKEGDIDLIFDIIRGDGDMARGTKEARDIANMDRPIDEQLEVDVPHQIKDLLVEIEQHIGEKETSIDVLSNIVDVYNKAKKETLTFESFIEDIQSTYPGYVVSPKAKQGVRSVFNRMQVEELQPYIHFDRLGNKLDYRTTHDPMGKRVADNRPPASDEVHFKAENVDKLAATAEAPPSPKKPSVKNQEIIDEIARLNAETSELDIGYDDIRQINWNSLIPNVQNNPKAQKLAQEFSDLNQKIQNMSPAELAELPESIRNEFIDYPAIWGYSRAQKGVSAHNIKNMLEMYEYTLRTEGKEIAEEYLKGREIDEKTPKEVVAKWRKGVEEINRVVEKEEAAAATAKEAPLAPPVAKVPTIKEPSIEYQDVIVSKKQDRIVGAQTDLKNNRIIVSKKVLQKKYKEKAWTKPKVKGVDPLPKDTFKTYEEWENFVIAHERAHFTKENRAIKNLAERENDANRIALEKIKPTIAPPKVEGFKEPVKSEDQIHNEWVEWIENPNYSPDARKEIIRADIPNFDPVRSKIEFANAKDYIYEENTDTFSERIGKDLKVFPPNIRINEIKSTRYGDRIVDLYDTRYDKESDSYVDVMKPSDWWNLAVNLDERNRYAKIPNKDKGTERVYPYHPEAKLEKWDEVVKELQKVDPKARDHIREDFDDWAMAFVRTEGFNFEDGFPNSEVGKKAWDIYRKMVMSNFLYEPHAQFKNAPDRVKRETLQASKGIPLREEDFLDIAPDGTIGFVIVDDVPKGNHKTNTVGTSHPKFYTTTDGKTRDSGKPYESLIDGWITLPEKIFSRIVNTEGFPESTSRIKPTVWAWVDGKLFAIKAGLHPSQAEYDKATGQSNVGIAAISSTKVLPDNTEIYWGEAGKDKKGNAEYRFKDKKGKKVKTKDLKPVKINIKDLRIDYGVKEDEHAYESQTIKKQFHVLLNELQVSKEGYESLMNEAFAPAIDGVKEANQVVKALTKNPKSPIPGNFHIKDIGDAEFVSIVNDPYHPLFKQLLMHMTKETKYNEYIDSFGEENSLIDIADYTTRLQRIAKYSDFDPVATMWEPELYQAMVLRYRKIKYMYPKWKYSASSWAAGVDPITTLKHGQIGEGTFKLGHSMRDKFKVRWGKTDTEQNLGELWDAYNTAVKDKKLTEAKSLADMLDIAVMRVPSSAVSGTRMLRFDGFIENSSKKPDHGAYLNPKDHFYLDGMDVDGDKVFMYQGLPKVFRDQIRKNKNEQSMKINGKDATYANKSKELNELFGTGETPALINSKVSQYLPSSLRKAGISSYSGKRGMGAVVNAKTMLNYMTADIIKNRGGKVQLDLMKKGKKYGTVTLETSEKKLDEVKGYRRLSVEASSRTADSSNYWEMMTPLEMREVLLKSAFNKIVVRDNKGKVIYDLRFDGKVKPLTTDFKYKDIVDTDYGNLYEVNNKLFGFNYKTNRQWNIEEVQKAMDGATSTEDRMNSLLWLSNRMSANAINLKYAKGNKEWRKLVNTLNDTWKEDKSVRDFLVRKKFMVRPTYLETDGTELQKRINDTKSKNADIGNIDIEGLKSMGLANNPNLDPRWQKVFDSAWADKVVRPMEPLKESKLILNDAMDIYSAIVVSKRGEKLFNAIVKAGRSEKDAHDFLGLLAEEAVLTKTNWRNARQGNKNKFLPAKYALDDVERSMKKVSRAINDRAKELGIETDLALDYYYTYMMSTLYPQPFSSQKSKKIITDWLSEQEAREKPNKEMVEYYKKALDNWSKFYNKTSLLRFPFETKEVPESIKKDFIQGFAKMWNVVRRDKPLVDTMKKDAETLIPEKVEIGDAVTRLQKEIESKIVLERFFDNIFKGKKMEDIPKDKIPEDIPRVMDMLVEDLKAMPPEYATSIEEMYAGYGLEGYGIAPRVSEATWKDLRQFQKFVRTTRIATAKVPRVKKAYYLAFPERLGEKQLAYDMTQVYKYDIPYNYAKEKVGFVNIRVPFSTFQYLSESFNQIYQFENAYKEAEQEEIQRAYDWRDQILGLDNGTTEFAQLHRAAISRKLSKGGEVSGTPESKAKRQEHYKKLWEEYKPIYDELKNKKYKITEDGKSKEKSGEEVMQWIIDKHEKTFDRIYKKWVTNEIDWSIIDDAKKRDYNGIKDHLVRFNEYGRMDVNRIQRMVLDAASFGKKKQFESLVNQTSLSVDLLNRMQYEIILEEQVAKKKLKPDSMEAKRYRERLRAQKDPKGDDQASAYKSIGRVREFYWPQMMHMATRKSRREVREFVNEQIGLLRSEAGKYADDILNVSKLSISKDDYKIKKKWMTSKSTKNNVEYLLNGEISKDEFIERFVAKQEVDYENFLGGRVSEDGGASKTATEWLLANKTDSRIFENIGFNERPGTGKARGENPMPGFSLDFDVVDAYSSQWVSSFHKNLTALVSHKAIDRFKRKNKILKEDDMKDWENFMKMYARDVMGYASVFSSDLIGLNKDQVKRYRARVKDFEKKPDNLITPEDMKDHKKLKEILRRDNRLKKVKKSVYYKLSDENVAKKLEWIAFKLGGKANPKLPLVGELPKTEQARKLALMNVAKKIGAFEAKWSLISLLSHPKTAMGNIMGGSVNTISRNGIRHFANTKDKPFLYNIFKGGKLRDGTKITPDNVNVWLNRFAEESGALESFIVSEAQLERGFRGTKMKGFAKEFVNELKKDYNMPDQSVYDLAKTHGLNKAMVDGGAWFMRKSERMLRRDSFLSHYLNNYEILSDIIPNLKFDNPYLLRMATEGVKATQFLYHASARPAFSRTATGKMLTRFMPFAWNSIRFRRLAYQRANIYGFDMNTAPGKRFQRLLMLDAFAFALANIFVSSIFDSALPPPMSYMQDTADWLFGDEKRRERAFFNQWPHPALAPLSTVTGPSLRLVLGPTKALINNDWEPFLNYQLWTWAPFGRFGRSFYRTAEVPEMWVEEMTGIPIHRASQMLKKARKEKEEEDEK